MANSADKRIVQSESLVRCDDPEQKKRAARARYLEWLKGQGIDDDSISTYRALIRRCDDFVTQNCISENGVLLEKDIATLELCYATLKKNFSFRTQPDSNSMLTALTRYIAFIEVTSSKNTYILHTVGKKYVGSTPAHALAQFLTALALRYPTYVHRVVGKLWKSRVYISNARKSIKDHNIANAKAFLTHSITLADAVEFGNWLCKEFGVEPNVEIEEILPTVIVEEKIDVAVSMSDIAPKERLEDGNIGHTVSANQCDNAKESEFKDMRAVLASYEQWLISQKSLSVKSAVVYRQALKSLPTLVDSNDVDMTLLSAPAPVIEAALNKYLDSADFGRGRISQFRCAVMSYLEFVGQYDVGHSESFEVTLHKGAEEDAADSTEEKLRITGILSAKFVNGLRKESFIDLRKFKKAWAEEFGSEYAKSDEDLKKTLASVCIDTGERWYLPSTLFSEEDKKLLDKEFLHFFDGDRHVLYISQLYDSVQKHLSNNLLTPELFGIVLRSQYRRKYYFSRDIVADVANVRLDIARDIENELICVGRPVAVNILQERLSYIPTDRIEKELRSNSHFIRNTRDKETGGEFFHDSMLRFTEAEMVEIVDIINGCILRDDYALRGDVLKRVFSRLPEVADRAVGYSGSGIWEVIRRRLVCSFSFTDTVACKLGVWLTNTDLMTMFCKNRTPFTWEEYKDFSHEIGAQQNSKLAQQYAFRISQNQYIAKSDIAFQVDQIDAAISIYFTPDAIRVEDILSFDAFPSCGYPWNHYLLEQYVWERSQKYCLDGGGNHGISGTIRLR